MFNYQQISIDELVDLVSQDLTIGCSLPQVLPNSEIIRFIQTRAIKYFNANYYYALSKVYYRLDRMAFQSDEWTQYSYITLPEEIQNVIWIHEIRSESLFQIGLNTPNMSVNLAISNTPYLSSYVSTIGDLGVYKSMLDSLSDMLNQMNKYTVKFHYNELMHRLNILTNMQYDLIITAYAAIPPEFLYTDQYFQKYVTGWAKQQAGNLLGRMTFNLQGGITYNYADLVAQGKEEMKEVEDALKQMSTSAAWFISPK